MPTYKQERDSVKVQESKEQERKHESYQRRQRLLKKCKDYNKRRNQGRRNAAVDNMNSNFNDEGKNPPKELFQTVNTGKKNASNEYIKLHYTISAQEGAKPYVPSWTDRIFFHGPDATAQKNIKDYKCDHSLTASDHAPVSAVITLTA